MKAKGDVISIVEAAWRLDLDANGWLDGLVEAAWPVLDEGFGVLGMAVDARAGNAKILSVAGRGFAGANLDMVDPIVEHGNPSSIFAMLTRPGCFTSTDAVGGSAVLDADPVWQQSRELGMGDYLHLNAIDVSHVACSLGAPLARAASVSPTRSSLLGRVGLHISAALRLRMHLGGVEAIFEPGGKPAHLESVAIGARDALREAVQNSERARGRLREDDVDQASSLWRAVVSGRWSLIDRYESDGRRYVVAHANPIHVPTPLSLTAAEAQCASLAALGHSNKEIAYARGVSTSRVGTVLGGAMRKLGAKSRAEFVVLVNALQSTREPPRP